LARSGRLAATQIGERWRISKGRDHQFSYNFPTIFSQSSANMAS
jgi:hypothetical protein